MTPQSGPPPLFLEALRLHQNGRLAEAEQGYRRVLADDARHADSLHLLGVIASQRGEHDAAVGLIFEAIAINPGMAPFHNNLGASLRALGRLAEAADSYRQAIRLKDAYPDAHNNLGATLRDLGQPVEAEAHFRRALQIRPDYVDAHNNLGNLLRETGRFQAAEASYRLALQTLPVNHPKTAQVLGNLGTLWRDQNRLTEAESSYRRALQLTPQDSLLHSNLGSVQQSQDNLFDAHLSFRRSLALRPDDAETWHHLARTLQLIGRVALAETPARRSVTLAPGFADGHNALGAILHDLGRLSSAEDHIERAIELEPANLIYHLNLTNARRYRADDPHLAAMERLLADSPAAADAEQHRLRFALAKAYEDLGDMDRAFAQQLVGNRLYRQHITYDEAATLAQMERIKAAFSADALRLAPPAAATGPIFIVGMMRSGSTLVEQILASHPQVWGGGELTLLRQAITLVAGRGSFPEVMDGVAAEDRARIGSHYRQLLQTEAGPAARSTDKFLHNFLYAGLIRQLLPDARIIHTRRDPVDTCLSCFSKLFVGRHPYAYDLGELGRYYRAYASLMQHWREVVPPGFILDVDYEAVVDDLEGQARRILAHCGLPWDDACLSFHQTDRTVRTASATQVRQPIYHTSVGRWRPDSAILKPLLDGLA